jgi:predicted transcriptional regulator
MLATHARACPAFVLLRFSSIGARSPVDGKPGTAYGVYNVYTRRLPMASPVLSFRVEEGLAQQLDLLAAATDRDRQYHLKRALVRYVEAESWHLQAISEGIADADAGNLTDLDAVKAKWAKRAEHRTDQQSTE